MYVWVLCGCSSVLTRHLETIVFALTCTRAFSQSLEGIHHVLILQQATQEWPKETLSGFVTATRQLQMTVVSDRPILSKQFDHRWVRYQFQAQSIVTLILVGAPAAVMVPPTTSTRPWKYVSIDLGTTTYFACRALAPHGSIFRGDKVKPVTLSSDGNNDNMGYMLAAWHNNRWYFGHGVLKNKGKIPEEIIIRWFKLLFYDHHASSPQAQLVQKQLDEAGKTPKDLLTAAIKYIWNDTEKNFRNEVSDYRRYRDRTIVYLSVPKLVTFEASELLISAAKAAGLPRVQLVFEPMCAGASIIEKMVCGSDFYHQRVSKCVRLFPTATSKSLLNMDRLDRTHLSSTVEEVHA